MPYRKPNITPEWIRVSEAAAQLGCHPKTVLNRIRAGTIPVRILRIERVTRLNRSDFETYLASLTENLSNRP